jgi:hypothetical protein
MEEKGMAAGLRITGRGSPGARLGALVQETVGKKTDLFAREGSRKRDNREADLFGFSGNKKTDLLGMDLGRTFGS